MASERLTYELRHLLRRCAKLSDPEMRFLVLISSYSLGCLLTYEEICSLTNWSRSKLSRTIRSLEQKRLIDIKYGPYKKTIIKIAPAGRQIEFVNNSNVSLMNQESYAIQESNMIHPWSSDVSPMAQPILERELERKKETDEKENANTNTRTLDVENLISEAFPNWNRKIVGGS